MDMQVDAQLIRNERLKRAWSQEQLAQVSGLGLRTVQRIENGGNASLETVKALAAVLALPIEALIAEPATPPAPLPSRALFRLFKPWPAFVSGCLVTLTTMGGLFIMQGAVAEQVDMDFAVRVDDEEITHSRVVGEAGMAAVVDVSEVVRISITPRVTQDGSVRTVLLEAEIFLFEDGEYKLLSNPKILTLNGQKAVFRIGNEESRNAADGKLQRDFDGVEVQITPRVD